MIWEIPVEEAWQKVVGDLVRAWPQGAVLGLSGPLGVGKTSLVRAFIRELSDPNLPGAVRVLSPSFVIHNSYPLRVPVEHFDFYRFEELGEKDLVEIGYFEALDRARKGNGFVFVEWPQQAKDPTILQLKAHANLSFGEMGRTLVLETIAEK